jgi:hypothetical protein
MMTLAELRRYLADELNNANKTQSEDGVELIAGRMWQRFIAYGISLYTLEGALQQIVATFSEEPEGDPDDE